MLSFKIPVTYIKNMVKTKSPMMTLVLKDWPIAKFQLGRKKVTINIKITAKQLDFFRFLI